jgi:hypothetical protein
MNYASLEREAMLVWDFSVKANIDKLKAAILALPEDAPNPDPATYPYLCRFIAKGEKVPTPAPTAATAR